MKRIIIPIAALLLLLCVLSSGCTTIFGTPAPATAVPTPVPTTVPVIATPPPATPSAAPTTEPLQFLPTDQQVNVLLTKDRPTSEIHLQYQGGPGERFINKVLMRVYTSDTEYQEFVMSDGKKPLPGDEIVVPGTRGKDRCEVFVVSAGIRYKVLDEAAVGGGYY
ncbi:MAG: hypothetical protein WC593_01470 [Methanoregula sp.]